MGQYRGKIKSHCMNGYTCRIFPEPMFTAAADSVCWNKGDSKTFKIGSKQLDLDTGKVGTVVHRILAFIIPPVKIRIIPGFQGNPRPWPIVEIVVL